MTDVTFPQFWLLPGEIRNFIWDHVVRSRGYRGVHYFSVLDTHVISLFARTKRFKQNHLVEKVHKGQIQVLAAPLSTLDMITPSWTVGNPSSYAIDGGLWTACRESRSAMCRRYKPSTKELVDRRTRLRFPLNDSATFKVSDRKSDQWFTVFPESDLFVLQSVSCIPDFMGLSQDSLFFSEDREDGLVHAENFAIEFDPTWNVEELRQYERDIEWDPSHDPIEHPPGNLSSTALSKDRFDEYDSLVQASMSLTTRGGSKLWLIDSRLRRKQTVMSSDTMRILGNWTYSGQGQKIFRENGCKFYAMPEYDNLEVCGDDGDGYEIAAQVCLFVEELAKCQHALLRDIDPSDGYSEQLGILVRERD